jgi:hypothetical protein
MPLPYPKEGERLLPLKKAKGPGMPGPLVGGG